NCTSGWRSPGSSGGFSAGHSRRAVGGRVGSRAKPLWHSSYRSCSVAILFAAIIVYQGAPAGATVIPNGPLSLTALPSVMTPALVMPAALPLVSWVNHTVPSDEAAMPEGPVLFTGNSVTELLDGSRRPTAWGVNRAVNQTCPSGAGGGARRPGG